MITVPLTGAPELDKFLVAPEGTPDHLVKILREAFAKVMKDPEVDKEGDKFFGDGWKPHGPECNTHPATLKRAGSTFYILNNLFAAA